MRRAAALGLMLAVLAGPAAARSTFTICNDDDRRTIKVAVVEEVGIPLFAPQWQASGWYEVAPGRCQSFGNRNTYQKFYLSITEVTEEGRRIRDYGVDRIPDWLGRSNAYGVERFFCVSDKPFERRLEKLNLHEGLCPTGYYLQLFNNFVWVEDRTDYKLTLN